jgi:hypothetical protein
VVLGSEQMSRVAAKESLAPTGAHSRYTTQPRPSAVLPNSKSRRCVSDPLPPSAALPLTALTEGENKALTLQAVISPS